MLDVDRFNPNILTSSSQYFQERFHQSTENKDFYQCNSATETIEKLQFVNWINNSIRTVRTAICKLLRTTQRSTFWAVVFKPRFSDSQDTSIASQNLTAEEKDLFNILTNSWSVITDLLVPVHIYQVSPLFSTNIHNSPISEYACLKAIFDWIITFEYFDSTGENIIN